MEPAYLDFVPGLISPSPLSPADVCLIFMDDIVLLTAEGQLPVRKQVERSFLSDCTLRYLGVFRGNACYYGNAPASTLCAGDLKKADLRTVLREMDTPVFHLCCRAFHLLSWRKRNGYCGACGQPLTDKTDEPARQCSACGAIVYPRISPAVIVAVVRDNTILLARNKRSRFAFYSVPAGFVEPGETLEECARREVFEETRIEIKDIRYFGSQPWPFPDSLMVGFTAEYAGGDIHVDENELETANWFTADTMPPVPMPPSISRKLIDWFLSSYMANGS